MMRVCLSLLFFLLAVAHSSAQQPKKPNAAEIYEQIEQLNVLASVLYVAAHPDDENTAMISYLSNNVHARTTYLSMTRGDGGQNLVGPELRELLGDIRTQELLAARRIDGGEQRFTRANDFGYSKNPKETLEIWDKDQVLADVVWAIRTLKPDVVVNRFDHRSQGTTHGHHTASAILSVEAFEMAGDPSKYPEQLKYTEVWQPKRQFFNTSWWFYGSREHFDKADKGNLISLDVGTYYPELGLSNTEISSVSRSQHKSQGFGNTGSRGSQTEYLELLKGDYPKSGNLLEGIDTSWSRIKGGVAIGTILKEAEKNYDFKNPSASLPQLLKAYPLITKLEDEYWKNLKLEELKNIIKGCAGLYLEAGTDQQTASAGDVIKVNLEAINRSDFPVRLISATVYPSQDPIAINKELKNNADFETNLKLSIVDAPLTTAYWLTEEGSLGMYNVQNQKLIGLPETPRIFKAIFNLKMGDVAIPFEENLVYKYNDRVDGEVYEPFEIVPPISARMEEPVLIFADAKAKTVKVAVTGYKNNIEASVSLKHPANWSVSPENQSVNIAQNGETKYVEFEVTPPADAAEANLSPLVEIDGKTYDKQITLIDYDHIPKQTLVMPNAAKAIRLDIQKKGQYIGYINGAGDAIPESLRQIGYQVVTIDPAKISPSYLKQFDAVVMGIRAYNTVDALVYKQTDLLKYVENGGTMIVQYNTARGFDFPNLGPYPITLSSDRVTDESAPVTMIDTNVEVLNSPNKITAADFENWVQERGLYFPSKWDEKYKSVFAMHDEGETPSEGSLLVADYGKGHYIYTGLSFFRELPAGVPGAYRLFANMLSIGRNDIKIK